MGTDLVAMLKEEEGALAEELAEDLKRLGPHYQIDDPQRVQQRSARLVAALIDSASGDPGPFVRYVRRIALERIAEGFCLGEIQRALTALEARAWEVPVDQSSIGSLIGHLSILSGTIGRAKDELASVYLEQKQKADRRVALLEQRLDELSKGTEAHIEAEA